MPEPISTTLLVTSAVLAVGAGVAGAVSSIQAGRAQRRASEFNAKVALNEATAQRQAAQARAKAIRRNQIRLLGTQKAIAGKSGITQDSFSDVIFDSAVEAERDRIAIIFGGDNASASGVAQSQLLRQQGKFAQRQGNFQAGASIIGGLSSGAGTATRISF